MAYNREPDPKYYEAMDMPASDGVAVTPSDTVNLATPCRALYIGASGNVALVTLGGTTLTFVGMVAGTVLPVRATRVQATNTTATSIVALW